MQPQRHISLAPLLTALFLFVDTAWAQAPLATTGAAHQDVSVQLVEEQKLRLVRYKYDKKGSLSAVSLDGRLRVTIRSLAATKTTLVLPRHRIHGLVFRPKNGGEPFVLLHDCQCVQDAQMKQNSTFRLAPGSENVETYSEWGCSGGPWVPPPPGSYLVSYRTLVYSESPVAKKIPNSEPLKNIIEKCQRDFRSDDYWKDAAYSNSIEVTLQKPIILKPNSP